MGGGFGSGGGDGQRGGEEARRGGGCGREMVAARSACKLTQGITVLTPHNDLPRRLTLIHP